MILVIGVKDRGVKVPVEVAYVRRTGGPDFWIVKKNWREIKQLIRDALKSIPNFSYDTHLPPKVLRSPKFVFGFTMEPNDDEYSDISSCDEFSDEEDRIPMVPPAEFHIRAAVLLRSESEGDDEKLVLNNFSVIENPPRKIYTQKVTKTTKLSLNGTPSSRVLNQANGTIRRPPGLKAETLTVGSCPPAGDRAKDDEAWDSLPQGSYYEERDDEEDDNGSAPLKGVTKDASVKPPVAPPVEEEEEEELPDIGSQPHYPSLNSILSLQALKNTLQSTNATTTAVQDILTRVESDKVNSNSSSANRASVSTTQNSDQAPATVTSESRRKRKSSSPVKSLPCLSASVASSPTTSHSSLNALAGPPLAPSSTSLIQKTVAPPPPKSTSPQKNAAGTPKQRGQANGLKRLRGKGRQGPRAKPKKTPKVKQGGPSVPVNTSASSPVIPLSSTLSSTIAISNATSISSPTISTVLSSSFNLPFSESPTRHVKTLAERKQYSPLLTTLTPAPLAAGALESRRLSKDPEPEVMITKEIVPRKRRRNLSSVVIKEEDDTLPAQPSTSTPAVVATPALAERREIDIQKAYREMIPIVRQYVASQRLGSSSRNRAYPPLAIESQSGSYSRNKPTPGSNKTNKSPSSSLSESSSRARSSQVAAVGAGSSFKTQTPVAPSAVAGSEFRTPASVIGPTKSVKSKSSYLSKPKSYGMKNSSSYNKASTSSVQSKASTSSTYTKASTPLSPTKSTSTSPLLPAHSSSHVRSTASQSVSSPRLAPLPRRGESSFLSISHYGRVPSYYQRSRSSLYAEAPLRCRRPESWEYSLPPRSLSYRRSDPDEDELMYRSRIYSELDSCESRYIYDPYDDGPYDGPYDDLYEAYPYRKSWGRENRGASYSLSERDYYARDIPPRSSLPSYRESFREPLPARASSSSATATTTSENIREVRGALTTAVQKESQPISISTNSSVSNKIIKETNENPPRKRLSSIGLDSIVNNYGDDEDNEDEEAEPRRKPSLSSYLTEEHLEHWHELVSEMADEDDESEEVEAPAPEEIDGMELFSFGDNVRKRPVRPSRKQGENQPPATAPSNSNGNNNSIAVQPVKPKVAPRPSERSGESGRSRSVSPDSDNSSRSPSTDMPPPLSRPPRTPKKRSRPTSTLFPHPSSRKSLQLDTEQQKDLERVGINRDLSIVSTYDLASNSHTIQTSLTYMSKLMNDEINADRIREIIMPTNGAPPPKVVKQPPPKRALSPDITLFCSVRRMTKKPNNNNNPPPLSTAIKQENGNGKSQEEGSSKGENNKVGITLVRELISRTEHVAAQKEQYQPRGDAYDLSQSSLCMLDMFPGYAAKSRRYKQNKERINKLTEEQLSQLFNQMLPTLKDMVAGKLLSRRVELWQRGGPYCMASLKKLYVVSPFSTVQGSLLSGLLEDHFLDFNINDGDILSKADYINFVLLPETAIRMYALVNNLDFDSAEEEMHNGAHGVVVNYN